jgi:hypothetical protein
LKSRARTAAIVVLVVLAVAAYAAYRSIDLLVVYAFEHYGPDILGVPVKVHGAHISIFDGEGRVNGLDIGAPAGFAAAHAAQVGEIRVALEPSTVTGPVVHVRELAVANAAITYERGEGPSNIDAILRHVREHVQKEGPARGDSQGSGKSPRHRYIVDRLTIRGVQVTVTHPALHGQGITFDLPEVELTDVGKRQGGATAGEIADLVGGTLEQKIAQKLLTRLDLLRQGGVQGAIDALRGLIRK